MNRPTCSRRPVLVAGLLGDDLVLDLVVGRLRHHLLLYELVRALVRPVLDLLDVDSALWALRTWLDSWSGIGHVATRATRSSTSHTSLGPVEI